MSSTLGASLLRTVLSDGTLKILGSGLDKGPIIDYLIVHVQPDILDKLIHQEQLTALWIALQSLSEEERSLIDELFFNDKSERMLASELGIATMTLHDRKHRILKKLRKLLEN